MANHRYILEPYKGMKTRYACPLCNSREKTFTRYVDTMTNEYINFNVGKCSRDNNCGYHYPPKQYFQDNNISFDNPQRKRLLKPKFIEPISRPVSFIPIEPFKQSLNDYEHNHFVSYLINLFGRDTTTKLIERYYIGTSNHWSGANVFWQVGVSGKVHAGKVMLYNQKTGKRIKEPYIHINWMHRILKLDFNLSQCFFGEHLLKVDPYKPVAIVESEKTAIIASVYLPQFIWLAAGSKVGLNSNKCKVLSGRNVVLYPDLKCYEKWDIKAKELSHITGFKVSDFLERNATESEKSQGLDLTDYLIRIEHNKFNIN